MQDKLVSQYNGIIAFDERTFARKVVKIYRTMKKMEYGKHLTPIYTDSFAELSEILL